ncbi:MAG: aminopeptidase P family protein [Saprospiraceae bacterium]
MTKATYIQRRAKLSHTVGSGLILLLGNDESPMNFTDNTFSFRQDSTFLYFFGVSRPNLVALIDCESGEEWILGNDFTVEDFVWMGEQPTIADQATAAGVAKTAPLSQLTELIGKATASKREIHFLPPYRAENRIKLFNWLGIAPQEQEGNVSIELIKAVVDQRNYKSAAEVDAIRQAVDISVEMHTLAMRMAKPGITEAQIAAAVQNLPASNGGRTAFPVIATINGHVLHNHHHDNILKEGDMFLLDAGAETANGYCGDLSSTIPVSGKFTSRQADIYNICLDSHNAAIEMLKPGISFKDVHFQAARVIIDGLKDLGIMKGDTEDAIVHGAHALFFPCGTGHMMGLDVHDMEDLGEVYVGYDGVPKSTQFGLKSLRLGRTLEPGFVLTIEPGIYFIPQLIDQWKANRHNTEYIDFAKLEEYRSFGGLRNEEDFLITSTGYELLGKPKPKTIADVEAEWAKG